MAPDVEALQHEADRLKTGMEVLKAERDKTGQPATDAEAEEVARLRKRVAELLEQIDARQRAARPQTVVTAPPPPAASLSAGIAASAGSGGQFAEGKYDEALAVCKALDLSALPPAERAMGQYLKACCLQKLGRCDEAAATFREVANWRDDEVLAEYGAVAPRHGQLAAGRTSKRSSPRPAVSGGGAIWPSEPGA